MAKKLKFNVEKTTVKTILVGLLVLIVLNLLDRWNIVNLVRFQPDVITLLAIVIVGIEIGVYKAIKNRGKLKGFDYFGLVVIFLAFIGLVLGWFGMSIQFFETFKGLIDVGLLIFVVIEIFRK